MWQAIVPSFSICGRPTAPGPGVRPARENPWRTGARSCRDRRRPGRFCRGSASAHPLSLRRRGSRSAGSRALPEKSPGMAPRRPPESALRRPSSNRTASTTARGGSAAAGSRRPGRPAAGNRPGRAHSGPSWPRARSAADRAAVGKQEALANVFWLRGCHVRESAAGEIGQANDRAGPTGPGNRSASGWWRQFENRLRRCRR